MDATKARELSSHDSVSQAVFVIALEKIRRVAQSGGRTITLPRYPFVIRHTVKDLLDKNGFIVVLGKTWLVNKDRLIVSW
jgi:hypothetical protein